MSCQPRSRVRGRQAIRGESQKDRNRRATAESALRHHKYYDEPDKFLPKKLIGKKAYANDSTVLSFGLGPRMCLGMLETKVITFFHLLKKCQLLPLVYGLKIALPCRESVSGSNSRKGTQSYSQ
uniref:Cytochrome P450 n=1 Tax=Trichogramma kaykai TaxID=54128 RepID=A0ABD2WEG7_9HYME